MIQTATNLYRYNYSEARTYIVATLFVVGNILLPQLAHLVPQGGLVWLPIYFFTLVGAYKYGWKVGLITAVASPLINSVLFGMPMPQMLPAIVTKSVFLALAAGFAASHFRKVSLLLFVAVVASYQVIGSLAEWAFTGSIAAALQDIRIGVPGLLLQVIGGYLTVKYLIKR